MADQSYDVALSFAGEQREYVRQVAEALEVAGIRYFYDERAAIEMWGEDLVEYFDRVFRHGSRFVAIFVSAAYRAKVWTRVEFRSAVARAITEEGVYILPVRFDDTELPGLPPTTAYLDARAMQPAEVARAIVEKLGQVPAADIPDLGRMPRVPPPDFNPYAETQEALRVLREGLTQRAQRLPPGWIGHTEDRGDRFLLRILRGGAPLYSLDIFLDGGFGENTICFYGRAGGGGDVGGASNAHGTVEWDRDRTAVIVRLFNMSLLPQMGADYRLTPAELVNAIWNEACDVIERDT